MEALLASPGRDEGENLVCPGAIESMTLNPMGRVAKASMLSLALALGVSACSNDYTVAYVYMTSATAQSAQDPHGLINGYQVDYQSGYLRPLADSPVDTGGRKTVGLVVAPNNLFLYTVNNFDSDVVEFAIGTDGKLYPQHTYNLSGSLATAAAIDAQGKFLYVTFTYQNTSTGAALYTPANPGPGGISVFPINSDNSLGTPTTVNVGRNPIGIATSATGNFVYVIEQDSATSANLLGFAENPATGALTALPGVTINAGNVASTGYSIGTNPANILGDKTGTHLYVTEQSLNQITTYSIGSNGVPSIVATTATDAGPKAMTFDVAVPSKYLYVVASDANTINGYSIGANGVPVRLSTARSVQAGTGPNCIAVIGAPSNAHPNHAVYLYTSNGLSSNASGEQLNEADGSLDQIIGSPFGGTVLPSCLVTVPAFPLR